MARLNSDGSSDTSFSGDGETAEPLGAYGGAGAVAVQSNGKIVAVGSTGDAYTNDYTVARYNPDGSLDTSFSGDGVQTQNIYVFDAANSVAVQPDGSILAAGEEFGSFAVARFTSDGTLDSTFGAAGVLTDHPEADGRAIALDSDGSFLVGGATTCCDETSRFLVTRYNNLGQTVAAFGVGGSATTDFDGDAPAENPPPLDSAPSQTSIAGPPPPPAVHSPTRCRKGYVKKKVKGKSRCVKRKKHKRKNHRGAAK